MLHVAADVGVHRRTDHPSCEVHTPTHTANIFLQSLRKLDMKGSGGRHFSVTQFSNLVSICNTVRYVAAR